MSILVQEISPTELAKRHPSDQSIIVDVREPWEVKLASLNTTICIPMHQVPEQLDRLDKSKTIFVMCHHGGRSLQVAQYLLRHGYEQVFNVSGGIHAWSTEVDNEIPIY